MEMLDKIAHVARRYEDLERQMADPLISVDYSKLNVLVKEHAEIEPLVKTYNAFEAQTQELADSREMREMEDDHEMQSYLDEEIKTLQSSIGDLKNELMRLLIPKDPRDKKNVFIEIRAGTGGDEAGIFAADLFRMYIRFAENQKWKASIVEENRTGVGGYKEVVIAVKGEGAYSRFKYESGVHRVQRVPVTESQGRVHTSAATVAVMPEVDDVEITLDERDLEITATFASGPGGQHMQKNATAARIVHKPTGLAVKIQTERSLTQNKRVGMAIIQARLQEMEETRHNAELAADRKAKIGSGDRSEKIRTYNYPQNRVTDHRINYTSYNLSAVMDGALTPFIDALTIADEAEKLAGLNQS